MIDVLFAHAFFLQNDAKQRDEKFRPYSPLATLYAAGILKASGISTELFDATLQKDEESFKKCLSSTKPRILAIYEDSFNFLSKMCLTHVRDATIRMIKYAKENGVYVIVSSSDASDDPKFYLSHGADFIMLGEAENTVKELTSHLLCNDPSNREMVSGIAYQDPSNPDKVIRTGPRHTERMLDKFPFPARDLLDIGSYRSAWKKTHGMFSMNMVTTRGCPYSCTWCAKPIWGKTYAVRAPSSVAKELELIKSDFSPDHVWFVDDIFGLKPGWVEEFAREVTARDAVVPFMIQSRADLIREEVARSLSTAGCVEVWLGAESGSQKVLDAMKKGITVEQIHRARDLLAKYEIKACYFIQFGYPGEVLEDIEATFELVRTTLPDDIGVSVSYPLPGTEFYDLVGPELNSKRHWRESNDLDIMFNGTFDSSYYRQLGKFLHYELDVRLEQTGNGRSGDLVKLNREWSELLNKAEQHRIIMPTKLAAN